MLTEPILIPSTDRFTIFPIKYETVWDFYQKAIASFWTVGEIQLKDDINQFSKLDKNTQYFIKHILAFFSGFDNIINENLAVRFYSEIQVPEIRCFYAFQLAMETIHAEMYGILIDSLIVDRDEKLHLFNALNTIPCIKKMADWSIYWLSNDRPFNERLIAFACIEGIMFSGAFASIYWLKQQGLMSGLCMSNEFISRDEALHTQFACHINTLLVNKAGNKITHAIIKEAVKLQEEFINVSLPCNLIGISSESMTQYIQYCGDRLAIQLGCLPIYDVNNPYPWMEAISIDSKVNFFERRPSEYSKSGYMSAKIVLVDDDNF